MQKEKKTADPYWNKHRLNKKSIQAYLNEEELKKVKHVLNMRGFKSYKEMIIQLCDEEINREK